jgi:anaerobic selenocysteine-containing dehydrogenase
LSRVADSMGAASGGGIYFLSEGVRGHLGNLFELFMGELGSENLLHYDYAHPHSLYAANSRFFGESELPYYDIGNASYLLSFGADYLNNWLSPVHHSLGFGHSRQGQDEVRGRFVQIEPKMSMSGAAADDWVPARPGTEGILALGIAHRVLAGGGYQGSDAQDWKSALAPYSVRQVTERTDVPADTIERLADEFAHADRGLAIGGGAAASHSNGIDTLVAINALNYLVGNIGKPGGVVFNPNPVNGGSTNSRQADYRAMQDLVDSAKQGQIDVLIINNTNPAFTLPHAAGFVEAMSSVPLIVSLSSMMDETALMADVILPSHTYLESWGDDMPAPGVGFSVAAVSQPVVSPLYDTRATGDIILGLAGKLGLSEAMPWASTKEFIKESWRQIYERDATEPGQFDTFWHEVLKSGVWGENTRRDTSAAIEKSVIESIGVTEPEFSGNSDEFPLVLHPYLSTMMYDGRGANLPWMQELPEPMTSIVYGSWVEINPTTAAEMGLNDGDLVRVSSEHGNVDAPVVVFPAIMPGVVAMPIGPGHDALGRYARQTGVNPIQILAPNVDAKSGCLATSATRVNLVATGKRVEVVRTGGESRQLGRNIVQTTGGDSESGGHSAKLNGIPIVVEPA